MNDLLESATPIADLLERFGALRGADQILVVISVAVAALTALAIALAGVAFLLRWRNRAKARRWTALEAEWESALLDALGGETNTQAILQRVSAGDALYFVGYLTRFARRLRGSERARVASIAAPFLPRIARQLRSRRPGVRARAIRTLGLLGLRDYSYQVIAALDDPSPFVAMTAARELSRREQPDFAHAVLVKLSRFHEWSTPYLATMLAGIGPGAAPYLRGTFADDRERTMVRIVAAEALRLLNDIPSAGVAAEVADSGTDRELVAAALRLIAAGGDAHHAVVVRRLARSADDVIRASALAALGAVGDSSDLPLLRRSLEAGSVWVAWHAARSLLAIGGRAALEAFAGAPDRPGAIARELLTADS